METITASNSLVDLMNLTHDAISLNAVYLGISVSAILVLAGILLGVFYFFNLKPLQEKITKQDDKMESQEKETTRVLKDTEEKNGKSLKDFEQKYEKHLNEILVKNNEKIILENKNIFAATEKSILEKIENVSEGKDIKLKEIIFSEVINKIAILEKILTFNIVNAKNDSNKNLVELNKTIAELKSNIKEIKREIKILNIYKYSKEGQMGAIIDSMDVLREDIKEKRWSILTSLERLSKEMDGIILESTYVSEIEEQLAILDKEPKYSVLVTEIRSKYLKK
ncbi:TPA: hypothetical protein DCS02_00805 [Candidatus Nomurabacteria bacterium]|nr:hypothetical protein [Candidatus Nomurabacteria bacterium]HBR66425.1 hypothetical protein [Candidatus Nomurabacteria bacterium]HCU47118.1 hypothetical protein [Candidatus Nomurabacteria bacterium]